MDLTLSSNVLVRGIWIKFSAMVHTNVKSGRKSVDLLTNEEDHYCNGLHDVKVGFGEEGIEKIISLYFFKNYIVTPQRLGRSEYAVSRART